MGLQSQYPLASHWCRAMLACAGAHTRYDTGRWELSCSFSPSFLTRPLVDVLADLILFLIPLRMVWRVNLPLDARRIMNCIFATSVLATLGNLVHIVFLFLRRRDTYNMITFTGHIQVSMIATFSPRCVSYMLRILGHDITYGLQPARRRTQHLQTDSQAAWNTSC